MSDRLHDTLATLRTDLDRAPLADSSAVRARGNQRTRRQAVGASLAVVALVAGAVGISGALTGNNNANNLPAPPAPTTTAPTVEPQLEMDSSVLLSAEDLPTVPNQAFTIGENIDFATAADAEERGLTACGKPPNGGQTPDRVLLRTFPSDLDALGWQWVAQYATATQSDKAYAALTTACSEDRIAEILDSRLPAGAVGVRNAAFTSDPGSEYNGNFTGVVRSGNVVVVLGLRAMVRENEVSLAKFDAAVLKAAGRIVNR